MPAPANDNWASATVLNLTTPVPITGIDLTSATYETGEPSLGSAIFNTSSFIGSVWFKFTTPSVLPEPFLSVDTLTSYPTGGYTDTALVAYTGASVSTLTEVSNGDDYGTALGSRMFIELAPSTTYYVQLLDWVGTAVHSPFTLTYGYYTPPATPANDDWDEAEPLSAAYAGSATAETYGATATEDSSYGPGVWFALPVPDPAPRSITLQFDDTLSMAFNATAVVGTSSTGLLVDFALLGTFNRTPATPISIDTSAMDPGDLLYIHVKGPEIFDGWASTDSLTFTWDSVFVPPNDDFADRIDISDLTGGWVNMDGIYLATHEAADVTAGPTVWYEWTCPFAMDSVTFDYDYSGGFIGSGVTAGIKVFSAPSGGTAPTGANLLATGSIFSLDEGNVSVTLTSPVEGTTYYVMPYFSSASGLNGDLGITIDYGTPAPPTPTDPGALGLQYRPVMKREITMPTPTIVDGSPVGWAPTSLSTEAAGIFAIHMGPQGSAMTDVSYFRDVPTELQSYTFVDPFTYGTAIISFPQITALDDLDGLGFLGTEDNPANVDIWFYELVPGSTIINPLTNQRTLGLGTGHKIWEGFIASRELAITEDNTSLQVQCQGALFQMDGYKQKPFFPRRPYCLEGLFWENWYPVFTPGDHGHYFGKSALRTRPLRTDWPTGWTKKIPPYKADEPNILTPVGAPGRLTTGYHTRNTGSWDASLTGFMQDMLAVMWTTNDSGVTAGNQWTLRCEENRQPVLMVRDRARTADFSFWAGTPGTTVTVSEDYTQKENSLYGEGTGIDGVVWRNAYVTGSWNRTDYTPLAHDSRVWPMDDNDDYDPNIMVKESKTSYGSGFQQVQAEKAAEKRLNNVKNAGLQGNITLRCDLPGMLKWDITAGMTVLVKGLNGSGSTGVRFHIAECVVNVSTQTVELKVDTKYRDLLTLEEARQRNIDPMTPSKLLQVNKRSVLIEDLLAPWDYEMGSGYIPKSAKHGKGPHEDRYNYFEGMDTDVVFPWESWTTTHKPSRSAYHVSDDGFTKGPFVKVDADNALSRYRWSFVPVLTAHKGTIKRVEIAAYDVHGNVLAVPFHASFYYTNVDYTYMPREGTNYSPFREGAFESISDTGEPWPAGNFNAPDQTMIIGWGNHNQKAGYSPGRSSADHPATGLLVDEASWGFDCSQTVDLGAAAGHGTDNDKEATTLWLALYAEYTEDVYFLGRIYKQEQGT